MDLHVVCLPDREKLFYFTVSHQLFASLRGWGFTEFNILFDLNLQILHMAANRITLMN